MMKRGLTELAKITIQADRPPDNERQKSEQPLISVIIPVYNVENYLIRCLQSADNQDYSNYEVLLIDDGSTDASGTICEQWAEKGFRVFHKANGGLSDARNYGLDRFLGDYVTFVDSDDYIEPTYLSYLYELISREKNCKVAQANHRIVWKSKIEMADTGKEDAILSSHDAAEAVLFHDRVDVSAWGKLYHRSVFEGFCEDRSDRLRFPTGRLYEDTYIFADILSKTKSYVYGHECQYNYMKSNPNSIVNQGFSERNLEYIKAAEKLADGIRSQYPDLEKGCVRRTNHARLSVLRYMEKCGREHNDTRNMLRKEILNDAKYYLTDSRTPRRDRIAVNLLKIGLTPFYLGWNVYMAVYQR